MGGPVAGFELYSPSERLEGVVSPVFENSVWVAGDRVRFVGNSFVA